MKDFNGDDIPGTVLESRTIGDGLEISTSVFDFVVTGGMYGSLFEPPTTDPDLNAKY